MSFEAFLRVIRLNDGEKNPPFLCVPPLNTDWHRTEAFSNNVSRSYGVNLKTSKTSTPVQQ